MKSKLFVLGAATLLLASCSNELDMPVDQAVMEGGTPLSINVLANPDTKAIAGQVTETALPENSSIGITLVKTGSPDGKYDNQTYNNVEYHSADGAAWRIVSGNVLLSATEGTVYGYYPYSVAATNIKEVPISATDGKDYMYAEPVAGIKNSNASVDLVMNHALSVVKFTIKKATTNGYTGTGSISSVKLEGATLASSGTMDITTGTVAATAGELTYGTTMSLGGSGELFAVPTGSESGIKFSVSMDGQTYTATTTPVTIEKGKQYAYTLNMSSTGLTVNTVTVTAWGAPEDIGSGDGQLVPDLWATAKQTDGVYAIKADGSPVDYETASASSDTYTGVGFVLYGKAYQVARVDAAGEEQSETVYWWKDNYDVILELDNRTTADNGKLAGYLGAIQTKIPDAQIPLDSNWKNWSSYSANAALADFDGFNNTEKIIAAQNNGDEAYTIGKAVTAFRNNGSYNEGYRDWFVPACGELAFMYLKRTELDELLNKIGGNTLSNFRYWSSSEHYDDSAWYVDFSGGTVDGTYKNYSGRRRLVRAI